MSARYRRPNLWPLVIIVGIVICVAPAIGPTLDLFSTISNLRDASRAVSTELSRLEPPRDLAEVTVVSIDQDASSVILTDGVTEETYALAGVDVSGADPDSVSDCLKAGATVLVERTESGVWLFPPTAPASSSEALNFELMGISGVEIVPTSDRYRAAVDALAAAFAGLPR